MELTHTQHGLFEDLVLASKGGDSYWTPFHDGGNYEIFHGGWNSNAFDINQELATANSSFVQLISPTELKSGVTFPFGESYPFHDEFTALPAEFGSSFDHYKYYQNLPTIPIQEEHEGMVEDVQVGRFGQIIDGFKQGKGFCKVEIEQPVASMDACTSTMAFCGNQKIKVEKVERQPSKNLMAERRRRKRLNDRLSMLRSIVPKISKMDRTSILGDTIDYMKDLLNKIHKLREESAEEDINQKNVVGNLKKLKPNEVLVRNPPKFEVERRNVDTRIELCCTSKPGLLMSTVSTLEALGLEIQQCVISCFNDFSVQASCSEVAEHRRIIGAEDVKQALFRNAGCGGRCL